MSLHINRGPPRNARQEGAFVVGLLPPAIAIELQEGLLHRVLCIVGIKQHGIHHPEDEARLALDERRELRI